MSLRKYVIVLRPDQPENCEFFGVWTHYTPKELEAAFSGRTDKMEALFNRLGARSWHKDDMVMFFAPRGGVREISNWDPIHELMPERMKRELA